MYVKNQLPLKTLVLWENQINLHPFTQDTLSRNITFLAGASVLSLKTQNVSNSTSCSKMRRPSTICGYFGISSFFPPHTINQVTAECSEIEWLLDKLCDTAFITGKGKEKRNHSRSNNRTNQCTVIIINVFLGSQLSVS